MTGRPPGRHLVGLIPLAAVVLVVPPALVACDGKTAQTASHGLPRLDSVRVAKEEKAARQRREASEMKSRVSRAARYARRDEGLVSFALVDRRGRRHGFDEHRQYVSASAVKALLLAAELRRLKAARLPLDPATRSTLEAMITVSDNDAADLIYSRVGDTGLREVAEKAGMRAFDVSGYWGNAQLTAADLARFYSRLERNLAGPESRTAMEMLNSVIDEQRWGIPAVAGDRWRPLFKGGWITTGLGELVHQAALLKGPRGERVSLAVMTDGQPSRTDAIADIEKIAGILLGRTAPQAGAAKESGAG